MRVNNYWYQGYGKSLRQWGKVGRHQERLKHIRFGADVPLKQRLLLAICAASFKHQQPKKKLRKVPKRR